MKRYLFLLFVISGYACFGQNYQCLQSGVKHYFTNANGYLRGIRIDSVRTSGSDLIYYPYHTPRGRYGYMPGGLALLDSTGGSWLGKRVVQKDDGTFLFDNLWGDTVVINTQAHPGDTWIFYNDTTSHYYTASVHSVDTMTVSGMLDSIKRIHILSYNSAGINVTDSLNDFDIILSKNNGFVKIFDLYTFPYHAPDTPFQQGLDYYLDAIVNYWPKKSNSIFSLTDFIDPSIIQLNDRSPGDIFEYSVYEPALCLPCGSAPVESSNPYQYYLDSFATKTFFADSVSYTCSGWNASQHYNPLAYYYSTPHNTYDIIPVNSSLTFYNTALIDTTLMPEEYKEITFRYYFPEDTSYCIKSPLYELFQSEIVGNQWEDLFFESSGLQKTFKTGFGEVNDYLYDVGNDIVYQTTLIYVEKSGQSCGTYVAPTPSGVPNTQVPVIHYDIYPNPATTSLTISSSNRINNVTITDLLGQIVSNGMYNSENVEVNVADLPPGVYLVKINDTVVRKFVKQ